MDIKITKTNQPKIKPTDESNLGFGRTYTDHMFIMRYNKEKGWHEPQIKPFEYISISPASPVLHYGQAIFEGLKAYRNLNDPDGIRLFRPDKNCERMNNSADRLCMPPVDKEIQLEAIKRLIDVERDWVPKSPGTSLYIRPFMISDGEGLGAFAASEYIFAIICSPSGLYFKNGLAPVKIHVERQYVRAVKGGMGFAKTAGNYACSFRATYDAAERGYDQVLWLDGRENKYVEEVGAMNMMFVIDGKITTAELNGSILPGVTRDSVIALAESLGYELDVRRISIDEIVEAHKSGRLTEAFGTGTAAVISPVGEFEYDGKTMMLNDNKVGPVAAHLYDELTGIQLGNKEDKFGWIHEVPRY